MFFVLWKYNVDETLNQVVHFLYDISIMANGLSEHISSSIKFCLRLLHCQYGFSPCVYQPSLLPLLYKKEKAKRQRKKDLRSNFHKIALLTFFNFVSATCPTKVITKSLQTKIGSVHVQYFFFPFCSSFPALKSIPLS